MPDIQKIVFIIETENLALSGPSVVTYFFFLFVPTTEPRLEHIHTHLYYQPFLRTILLQNHSRGWN